MLPNLHVFALAWSFRVFTGENFNYQSAGHKSDSQPIKEAPVRIRCDILSNGSMRPTLHFIATGNVHLDRTVA